MLSLPAAENSVWGEVNKMKDSISVEYDLLEELFSQKTPQLSVPDKDDSKLLRRQSATMEVGAGVCVCCLLYTSPSPRDKPRSRMPSSA